jgi:hypothetical protein
MQGRARTPSGETASTLILIGLILQAIEVAIFLSIGLFLVIFPFFGLFVLGLGGIGVVWVILVYLFSYSPTRNGDYAGARTATLVFAILSLLTLGLISGILYIVAYAKLGDAEREAARPPPGWGAPPLRPGWKFCPACGRPALATSSFCQSCGARIG